MKVSGPWHNKYYQYTLVVIVCNLANAVTIDYMQPCNNCYSISKVAYNHCVCTKYLITT